MAKTIFHQNEVLYQKRSVSLNSPFSAVKEEKTETEEEEAYSGPTIDDIKREVNAFKASWEIERDRMIKESEEQAVSIIRQADEQAEQKNLEAEAKAKQLREGAEQESQHLLTRAEESVQLMREKSEMEIKKVQDEAYKEGFGQGEAAGLEQGKNEADRLISHLHSIINQAIEKRSRFVDSLEQDIIELVLLMARKVVKVISENQQNVVINNVIQALSRLKKRSDITIRVNFSDLAYMQNKIETVKSSIELVEGVKVVEDTTVDRGGCVIETDFGRIEARVANQLQEIEDRILELIPEFKEEYK